MTTKNIKLQGYIKPDIFEVYKAFKESRCISTDSQALNILLGEFLKVEISNVEHPSNIDEKIALALSSIYMRLENLENSINQGTLSDKYMILDSDIKLDSNLESNLESITTRELCDRYNLKTSTVSSWISRKNFDKIPDQWQWNSETKKFERNIETKNGNSNT